MAYLKSVSGVVEWKGTNERSPHVWEFPTDKLPNYDDTELSEQWFTVEQVDVVARVPERPTPGMLLVAGIMYKVWLPLTALCEGTFRLHTTKGFRFPESLIIPARQSLVIRAAPGEDAGSIESVSMRMRWYAGRALGVS
jgi:hypothetical protein